MTKSRTYSRSNRHLVVFADTSLDLDLVRLTRHARELAVECDERDLLIHTFFGASTLAMRHRNDLQAPDAGFCAILIGKDGTEKRRYPSAPDLTAVFALIDSMPMRQREMRANRLALAAG